MDIHTILIMLHLLGFAFGVGGATASDMTFVRATKDGKVTGSEFKIIKTLSLLVWTSVALLILSGAALMLLEFDRTGELARLSWSFFQLKLTAFAVLVINGIVFHTHVFPLLKRSVGNSFRATEFLSKYGIFGLTGGISIVSWYTAFLSVALSSFLIDLPYLLLLNAYLFLISGAALSAFTVLHKHAAETGLLKTIPLVLKRPFFQVMLLLSTGFFVLLATQIYTVLV